MAPLDASMQEALLKDPRVADAVKTAGQDALSDPAVQKKILDVCKEKFPEHAAAAKDQVVAWAQDPEVQAKAKEVAGRVASRAAEFAGSAGSKFLDQLEHGPAGVRVLAALGSLASVANSVLSILNVGSLIGQTIVYLISFYQLVFGLTTLLFELPPNWIVQIEEKTKFPVSKYQDMLMENAKFLCQVGGRGLFYVFQGSLWLAFASITEPLDLSVGIYLFFIGVLHVGMNFGILPQTVSEKLRQGYQRLATRAPEAETTALHP